MEITLDPKLRDALIEQGQRLNVAPEELALDALRQRFLTRRQLFEPRDEWERGLVDLARDCGTSLSNEAVSSEGIYE